MNVGSFTLILLITHFALPGSLRVKVMGWICVSLSVCVFAAPLTIVVSENYNYWWVHLVKLSLHNTTSPVSYSFINSFLAMQARVIRTKSVEFMPFYLSLFLTLSATMWFAYGFFLHDICITVSIYYINIEC